jgi:hypothetical protein
MEIEEQLPTATAGQGFWVTEIEDYHQHPYSLLLAAIQREDQLSALDLLLNEGAGSGSPCHVATCPSVQARFSNILSSTPADAPLKPERPLPGGLNPVVIEVAALGQRAVLEAVLDRQPQAVWEEDGFLGGTPLAWACLEGHTDCVQLLLNRGAQVDLAVRHSGDTALHLAASECWMSICAP